MHQATTGARNTLTCGDSAAEPPCEVIVAVEPPLFRDMLTRLIGRIDGLHVRAKLAGPSGLAPLLEHTGAQWVIVTLGPDGEMPESVDSVLAGHPSISVLGMAEDGSQVKVEHAGSAAEILANPSLAMLIGVMLENSRHDVKKEVSGWTFWRGRSCAR